VSQSRSNAPRPTLSTYREHLPHPELRHLVACTWERESAEERRQLVVPDGCVDLIWLADRELVIAGADTRPRQVRLAARTHTAGIRLRPGAAGAVLGLPASELRDLLCPASSVWGEQASALEEALAAARPQQRLELLSAAVDRRRAEPDELVVAAARHLAGTGSRVGEVAIELGISERQLHRRTLAAVGYGPKMLARVARLRRLVALRGQPLAWRALEAGYASQAHMTDEVRRLTGLTPVRFLEDAEPMLA
jgi:methylphosphotriester-DNA--protein-cysteine methyltransferase